MVIGIFIGAFIWLMFELNKAVKKNDFSYKTFFKLNAIPFVTNICCGLAIYWSREDLKDYIIMTNFSSIILGMSGQAILKKLVGIFDKNIETHIGINKSSN